MQGHPLSVVGLQFDVAWENAPENRDRIEAFVKERAPAAGDLVVLPEMCTSGFSFDPGRAAEGEGGTTERFLGGLARRFAIWLVAGLAVIESGGYATNQAVVFGPDGVVVVRYRKQRPFAPGGEDQHYRAGDGPVVFEWSGCRVAPFICYDLRFPELFRAAAARWQPELFLVIASWPETRIAHWDKLLQARAIENQAYVLGMNRVGSDLTHRHTGHSKLVNPWGEVLADAGEATGWVGGSLDLAALLNYRTKLPFLKGLAC